MKVEIDVKIDKESFFLGYIAACGFLTNYGSAGPELRGSIHDAANTHYATLHST